LLSGWGRSRACGFGYGLARFGASGCLHADAVATLKPSSRIVSRTLQTRGLRPPSSSIRPVPGRAAQALAIDATPYPSLDITDLSTDDLKAIAVVLKKYSADAAELAESGELPLGAGSVGASGSRQR